MKVIGTGETVTDIIIRNGKPEDMVCGGSCYNSMISLGRSGVEAVFIGEVGGDRLGEQTKRFLEDNGVDASFVKTTEGKKSQLSLAFLNAENNAEYVFYKDHASDIFPTVLPEIERGDVVLYGSFFAVNPIIHPALSAYLDKANSKDAIIYYDINFRSSHLNDKERVSGEIIDNLSKATIVRGSDEDFENVFGLTDSKDIYEKVKPFCENLIITRGGKNLSIITPNFKKDYDVPVTKVISTVGAGDNFNAGFVYGLIINNIEKSQLSNLPEETWNQLVATATRFSSEVCGTTNNYISIETGKSLQQET